jgi:alkyl hydroperoxide reductase subunit AhpF
VPSLNTRPVTALPTRAELLQSLTSDKEYDVLVIGGGATGAGIALDSQTRGMFLDDFGSTFFGQVYVRHWWNMMISHRVRVVGVRN